MCLTKYIFYFIFNIILKHNGMSSNKENNALRLKYSNLGLRMSVTKPLFSFMSSLCGC